MICGCPSAPIKQIRKSLSRCRCKIRGPACAPCTDSLLLTPPCWSIREQQGTKPRVLGEIHANFLPIRFGSDKRACDAHQRQFLLGVRRYIRCYRMYLRHRPETAPPRSMGREALRLSSRRASSPPSSSQQWALAASFVTGADSRDSAFRPIPLRSAPTVPSLR